MKLFIFIFSVLMFLSQSVFAGQITQNASQLLISPEMKCVLQKIEDSTNASTIQAIISEVTENNVSTEELEFETRTTSEVSINVYTEQQGDGGDIFEAGVVTSKVTFVQELMGSYFQFDFEFSPHSEFNKLIDLKSCNTEITP